MSNVKDDLNELLTKSALNLLDAVDIMNDGPDDSDVAMAQGRLAKAHEYAKAWKRLWKESYGEVYAMPTL